MYDIESLLKDLNDEQRAAVTAEDGPLLIVAGAGTGKTTVVTRRIAWLILTERCRPEEILALTFTDKAAGEMEERVDVILPYGYVDLWISTFHSFCERILRQHALDIGLPSDFRLLNQTQIWMLIRKNLDRFDLDYYRPRGNPTKFIHALVSHFSRAKDEALSSEDYVAFVKNLQLQSDTAGEMAEAQAMENRRVTEIAHAYHVYHQLLLENSALDFGSLITYTLRLFVERPALLEQYRSQFKYVLVDEFQDTNWAQYELVKLLAAPRNNLTVVADDDQAIYRFRGASLSNILEFKQQYPESTDVVLSRNYRSLQNILDFSYSFIQQNNPNRLEHRLTSGHDGWSLEGFTKQLQAYHEGEGVVGHIHTATLEEEVRAVGDKIIELKKEDPSLAWKDIAILVRSNASAEPFIDYFDSIELPYRFLALRGLYAKPLVIDILSYLSVLVSPHESPALYRVFTLPGCEISTEALVSLGYYARKKGYSLWKAVLEADLVTDISPEDRERLTEVVARIRNHVKLARFKAPLEVFVTVVHELGIIERVQETFPREMREQMSYLQQVYKKIQSFQQEFPEGRIRDFMELVSFEQEAGDEGALAADVDADYDAVQIMTVHASKGLEFPYVFVVNMVDKRFPSIGRSEPIPLVDALVKETVLEGDIHLEEERRLFYVAVTRAKRGVFFTSAEHYGGVRKKKLSRFLTEMSFEAPAVSRGDEGRENLFSTREAKRSDGGEMTFALPKLFSFTQLAAFSMCPLQYKYGFLLRIPVHGKPSLSFGRTMHNTLEKYFTLILESQQGVQGDLFKSGEDGYTKERSLPPIEKLLGLYEAEWIDDWYRSEREREEYFAKGKESLRTLYAQLEKDPPTPHSLEKDFVFKLEVDGERFSLRGRVDRIDKVEGGVEIVDYKTGTPKEDGKLRKEDKEQLLLYQMASEEIFGEVPVGLTYYYLEDGSTVTFLGTEKEKDALKEKVAKQIKALRESDFAATPGFHCRYCDFKSICEYRQ